MSGHRVHITETITRDVQPEFTYKPNPWNPLRIDVHDANGDLLPERAITVVLGPRADVLQALREQQHRLHRGLGVHR
jgi:hypothetical protein